MPYLEETLNSVRNQTLLADEVVVVENGSSDGTLEFLNKQPDIKIVVQPHAVSAARNWSKAIELATGDFVKMLCADDLLVPTCLERQTYALVSNPSCVFATGQRDIIGPDSSTIFRLVGLAGMRGVMNGRTALRRALTLGTNLFGEPSAIMFRRSIVQAYLPWPDDTGYATDLFMYIRVLQDGDVYLDNEVVAKYRITNKTWSFDVRESQAHDVCRAFSRSLELGLVDASKPRLYIGRCLARVRQLLRSVVYWRLRLSSTHKSA